MAIAAVKKYLTEALDEVYAVSSRTAVLDGDSSMVQEGANAGELMIPKISMDGLGDYSKTNGYPNGSATLEWETVSADFDRGRGFQVDAVENADAAGVAFARLGGQFERTKVTPELDAERFAKYAGTSNISTVSGAALSTGSDAIAAITTAWATMSEDSVPEDGRYLFITPTIHANIDALDTTKSRAVMARFAGIIDVPQTQFYTAITQADGVTSGQEAGGYSKASGAKNINFMIVQKEAVDQFIKHRVNKIIDAETNQTADAWKLNVRVVGVARVRDNKVKGIYLHKSTT